MAYRSSSEPGAIIEPGLLVCGPPSVASECAAGTYEVETPPLPVGSTVQYEFRRYAGAAANFSTFCEGSITVQERAQVVTCVYDYSGASAPLPDVAIERVQVIPTASLAGLLLVGTAAIWYVASRYRRIRTS